MELLLFLIAAALPLLFILGRALLRHPKPSRWSDTERAAGIGIATWLAGPIVALGVPLVGYPEWGAMAWIFMAASSLGAFLAARYVPSAWCLVIPTSVLVPAVFTFGVTTLWAFDTGWQGLEFADPGAGDQGPGFGIAIFLVVLAVMAPLWGFVLGLLSHLYLRHRPDSATT